MIKDAIAPATNPRIAATAMFNVFRGATGLSGATASINFIGGRSFELLVDIRGSLSLITSSPQRFAVLATRFGSLPLTLSLTRLASGRPRAVNSSSSFASVGFTRTSPASFRWSKRDLASSTIVWTSNAGGDWGPIMNLRLGLLGSASVRPSSGGLATNRSASASYRGGARKPKRTAASAATRVTTVIVPRLRHRMFRYCRRSISSSTRAHL